MRADGDIDGDRWQRLSGLDGGFESREKMKDKAV
ncbi:hypothetical protein CCACVL1_09276 [Corchorus capsularis]|uniref:Uncharacterized protein n=1 Tax=Corchorus capsularis TaxID=210143 RepID=A0A1R3IWU6_COCAP|nr:hypothetical protein CCACVL1_09276 [Corchorus capsularis]